jgi:hypothetical protein
VIPPVSAEALAFLDLDGCVLAEPSWWMCTRDGAALYITDRSDPVAVFDEVQLRPDHNPYAATLFEIDGGGILYLPSNSGFEMFDVAPWPDLAVIDTDCLPGRESPGLC